MRIEATALEKWYLRDRKGSNRFFAVRRASLALEPGKVTVLIGRSGSGKTTLLQMLSGLLKPNGGRVLADDRDLFVLDDEALSAFRNAHFGMIPQGADLLGTLTVMENILLPWSIGVGRTGRKPAAGQSREKGRGEKEERTVRDTHALQTEAQALCERLGIAELARVPARELSGGERRRACIARALAGHPEAVFADEPTSDLDEANARLVLELLKEEAGRGAALLIVTHDREAESWADEMLRMESGICQ